MAQCGHGCGWSSAVPISANGPRTAPACPADCTGEKGIVVHIFLQIAVARLSKPRFAPFSFSRDATLSTIQMFATTTRHTPFSSADIMDCMLHTACILRSIADFDKDARFDSHRANTSINTSLRELNERLETVLNRWMDHDEGILRGILWGRFYKSARLFGNKSFLNLWSLVPLFLFFFFFFFYRRVNER